MLTVNAILFAAVPEISNYYAQKSYGIYRVASEFRLQGLTTQVIHYFNRFSNTEKDQLVSQYVSSATTIIGFSTMFWEHYTESEKEKVIESSLNLIVKIKQKNPKVKVIAGGPSCRIFLSTKFSNLVDAIFEGFSENDFIKYVTSIKLNLPEPVANFKIYNINVYNNINGNFNFSNSQTIYVKTDYLDHSDVPILEVGRGCIFKCKFCGFALNGKKKFDYIKDAKILREELIKNYENFGITNYILSDDTFNDSTYKVKLLHNVFTSLPFRIQFSCYLRLDLLYAHPEQIILLKEMGLIGAFFGIESFYYEAAKLIGKGLSPDIAKSMLHDLKLVHWGNKIKIGIGLIVGLPHETYKSHQDTINWILDESNLVDQVVPFPLTVNNPNRSRPAPWDSEFQKNSEKYGFSWPDNHEYNWENSIGPIKSRKEAEEIYHKYCDAVSKSSRWKQGGFNLLKALPMILSYDPSLSLDILLSMNRNDYTKFIKSIEQNKENEIRYVNSYKSKILSS